MQRAIFNVRHWRKTDVLPLATQGEGNASKLTVYLQNGEVQYTYAFYDSYISAVTLSRDGTQGVVSTVSTNNGAMQSVLHLFDFSKETPGFLP